MKKILILTLLSISFSINSQWLLQTSQFNKPVVKIYFHDNLTGWLAVAGTYTFASTGNFAFTTNGGDNWNIVLSGCTQYTDFDFINSSTGWLIGTCTFDTPPYNIGYLLKSTNGGLNFNYQKIDTGKSYTAIDFLNENTGWLCITQNKIYKTTNSGNNWNLVYDTLLSPPYNQIFFKDVNTGYLINVYSIFKTTSGGANWKTLYTGTGSNQLNRFYFVNDSIGYLCGKAGKVYKTTNSGENWNLQNTSTQLSLQSVYFINELTGFIAGNDGYNSFSRIILKTSNGGINWAGEFSGNSHGLNSVFFLNSNTGWVAGGESMNSYGVGVVYKTTTGGIPIGITPISTEIPNQFSLSQNYPNPFNPSTKIKFQIPATPSPSGRVGVGLIIYDILGKEVATLVNQQLQPGTYEVEWDASDYPSGVYFYKLSAGEFTETKKMILLK